MLARRVATLFGLRDLYTNAKVFPLKPTSRDFVGKKKKKKKRKENEPARQRERKEIECKIGVANTRVESLRGSLKGKRQVIHLEKVDEYFGKKEKRSARK